MKDSEHAKTTFLFIVSSLYLYTGRLSVSGIALVNRDFTKCKHWAWDTLKLLKFILGSEAERYERKEIAPRFRNE